MVADLYHKKGKISDCFKKALPWFFSNVIIKKALRGRVSQQPRKRGTQLFTHLVHLIFSVLDKNYSSIDAMLNGIANGEVKYGFLDQYKAYVYNSRLKNMKIKIKRLIDIEGSIGLLAAGNAKKLRYCIETYVKENSGMVVDMVSKYNKVCSVEFVLSCLYVFMFC